MYSMLRWPLRLLSLSRSRESSVLSITQSKFFAESSMTKSALIILAPGAEEMEFTIAADVLRRAGVSDNP